MKKILVAVYDVKTGVYDRPLTYLKEGEAVRAFSDVVNEKGNMISMHPEDYKMMVIGEMDMETGVITPLNRYLMDASQLIIKKEN